MQDFPENELALLRQMLARSCNAPLTSSVGRLFDAVAALLGLRQKTSFEGQAAMELEFAVQPGIEAAYPFDVEEAEETAPLIVDWQPTIEAVLIDLHQKCPIPQIAAKFHNTLAVIIVAMARRAGVENVALSGGCFQNAYLTEQAVRRLIEAGFKPHWHQRVPPNDGGIALGQVIGAALAFSHAEAH